MYEVSYIYAAGSGFTVARYLSDGSLDTDFGYQGGITGPSLYGGTVSKLLVEPDGSLAEIGVYSGNLYYVHLSADGKYAPCYNLDVAASSCDAALLAGNQIVVTTVVAGQAELLYVTAAGTVENNTVTSPSIVSNPHVVTEPDGVVILAGDDSAGTFTLERYRAGVLIPQRPGENYTFSSASSFTPSALAVQPDGKIVAAGVDAALAQPDEWALARFNADGTFDDAFSASGDVLDGGVAGTPSALAVRPDGELFLAGTNASATDAVLAAYTSGGLGLPVANVAPYNLSVTPSASEIDAYDSVSLTGSFTDPGTQESFTVRVAWGDGSNDTILWLDPGVTTFSMPAHEYRLAGIYTMGVTVSEDAVDGEATTASVPITVNALPSSGLTLSISRDIVGPGETAVLTGTFAAAGTAGPRTVTIDWGDGTDGTPHTTVLTLAPSQLSFQVVLPQYAQPGNYQVTANVVDGDGEVAPVTGTVQTASLPRRH